MSTQMVKSTNNLSYNQIKKRRMLRQSKSKSKLKSSQATMEIVHTQKKVYPNQYPNPKADLYANQRPNQINQIRQIKMLQSSYSNQIKNTVKRRISNNFTERVQSKNQQVIKSKDQGQNQVVFSGANSRQIVKQLIEESKSQRKLVLYKNLRNKFKISKSRSRSNNNSVNSLKQKSKILAKRLMQIDDITPEKPSHSPLTGIKNVNRIKRFESVNQNPKSSNHNFRYLVNVPRQSSKQLFKGIKKQLQIRTIDSNLESSIQYKKQSTLFNQSDDKFLQQMCLKPNKSHQIRQNKEGTIKQKSTKDDKKNKKKNSKNQNKIYVDSDNQEDYNEHISVKKQKKQKQQNKQKQKLKQKQREKYKNKQVISNMKSQNSSNYNQNLLDLLDVEQRDLQKVLVKKQRQKKIMKDLQKLNKRFPKGFFKL